jgi:hypothetical protein
MHLTHSPVRFAKAVQDINQPHKDVIEAMGFGGLLHMPETCLMRNMILDFADAYQASNQSFNICDQNITIHPEDVSSIMGLLIEGYDVDKYVKKTMQSEEKTANTEFYKRYADGRHKLELSRLEQMISTSKTPDDDFKRAFVVFTIGVILASTTQTLAHWSYIQVIREVSVIPKLNWGQFTLTHLLDSCHSYKTCKQATLHGNLALLQVSSIWYNQHL